MRTRQPCFTQLKWSHWSHDCRSSYREHRLEWQVRISSRLSVVCFEQLSGYISSFVLHVMHYELQTCVYI